MNRKSHWEQIYSTRAPTTVSWYQSNPTRSLELIRAAGIAPDEPLIDVGGGASRLVDALLEQGFSRLAVLDISAAALAHAKSRLDGKADAVTWFEADVTEFAAPHRFHLWHDRAVFHFLTDAHDRKRYLRVLNETLVPGGHLIIAAFAIGGPEKCSGLKIIQYDAPKLQAELGEDFELLETCDEVHITPADKEQKFSFFHLRRRAVD